MAAVCCLVSCSSKIPRFSLSSRARIKASSASGVISSQSEAQKSAPKTAIFWADKPGDKLWRVGKARKPEKRHLGGAAGRAIGGLVIGGEALDDLVLRRLFAQLAQGSGGMRKGVMADRMSLGDFALDQSGQGLGIAADEEKSRLHAFRRQRVENPSAWFARKARRRR